MLNLFNKNIDSHLNLTIKSISLFILVSVAWFFGSIELVDTFSNFSNQWHWYVLATAYTLILNEIFSHRICSHNLFEVDPNRITYKILTFLLIVDHAWSPLSDVCLTHQGHHAYADKGKTDNSDWSRHWYSLCTLSPFTFIYQSPTHYPNAKKFFSLQRKKHTKILNDSWTYFCENNRIILTILYWLVLYLALPTILFKVVLMGRVLASIHIALATFGTHRKLLGSYRNFNLPNQSHNNLLLHYACLGMHGSMLHNNHHAIPHYENHGVRWFELDLSYYFIKLLKPLLIKKTQQTEK